MSTPMNVPSARVAPILDPGFVPAVLWKQSYQALCAATAGSRRVVLGIGRPDGTTFRREMMVLPAEPAWAALTAKAVEREVKFLLWQWGGSRIFVAGAPEIAVALALQYAPGGAHAFDSETIGRGVYGEDMRVEGCDESSIPTTHETGRSLGRNLDGCRIGFDLGGSDRKCAAVIDGKVVFSEEITWSPYFESDPAYHLAGIQDSLERAAAHLPRVDAIGGSAAGIYVDNEVRVASLFRGVSPEAFESDVRGIFLRLRELWGVPCEVINDGEVTALAGSMSLGDTAVLGVAMGTSLAAGYCNPQGEVTSWLNELAFVPIDYREDAPRDEWSGDIGCGVQYFSQQGVARLLPAAGIETPAEMRLPERLVILQEQMAAGDERAQRLYETIGTYFGYAIAQYADHYELRNLLLLGRVSSGAGGEAIVAKANEVLALEFPDLHERIGITSPDESMKRHGQAIAAASLPDIRNGKQGASC